jgi:hypothetical protein
MIALYLSNARYRAALLRIRSLIQGGAPLVTDDSDVTGDKHTHCTWGLCSESGDAWPDAEDHLWPDQFLEHGRIAPKYLRKHQVCPFQKAAPSGFGCFYSCVIFGVKRGSQITREQALAAYDRTLSRLGHPHERGE